MNTVCLSGNATKDAVKVPTKTGLAMTKIILAVEKFRNTNAGESKATVFIDIVGYGTLAKYMDQIIKGDLVEVEGQIDCFSYNGSWRFNIVANQVKNLGRKKSGEPRMSADDETVDMAEAFEGSPEY